MKKIFRKLFDYTSLVKFKSNVSKEESIKKIKDIAKKNTLLIEILCAVSETELVGYVTDSKVVLHRVRPFLKVFYNPFFYGKFTNVGGTVFLEGKFTMRKFVKVFVILGLTILSLFELVIVISVFDRSANQFSAYQVFVAIFFIPFFVLLTLGILILIKRWAKRDVDHISATISKALQV